MSSETEAAEVPAPAWVPSIGEQVIAPQGNATLVAKDGMGDCVVRYDNQDRFPGRHVYELAQINPRPGAVVKGPRPSPSPANPPSTPAPSSGESTAEVTAAANADAQPATEPVAGEPAERK